jgi:hypothetical protein
MQMGHEYDAQIRRLQRADASVGDRGFCTSDNARTEVDEVWDFVDDDGGCGSGAIRISRRISRP